MKSLKESRLRIPTNRFWEVPESVKGWDIGGDLLGGVQKIQERV
uniref:MYCBP associated protein n=1 Tax=Moschus moschiferus TaxID=68415 RepID=A0A8C6G3G0_MOSMO